jgi:GNAT superfamily N-acetyltransferase
MSVYRIELLVAQDRSAFVSGSDALDRYLRERAKQDMRRRVASCFVAVDNDSVIVGYYTIAAISLILDKLSPERIKRLPRYPSIPAVLLGRLAIAQAYQGKRLGGALVADALLRCYAQHVPK